MARFHSAPLLVLLFAIVACSRSGAGPAPLDPGLQLNDALQLPAGSYPLANPAVDPSVELRDTNSGTVVKLTPGTSLDFSLPFTAPKDNVVAAGIRFGDRGPIHVVPAASPDPGTLEFSIGIPATICAELPAVCHEINCYVYAVTDVGQVSTGNVQRVALACGGCEEPSCRQLLDECRGGEFSEGTFVWSGAATGKDYVAIATVLPATHCSSGSSLWLAGSSGPESVILQVPTDVRPGIHGITSNCRYHAEYSDGFSIAMEVWRGNPSGGAGTITITANTETSIRGTFTFTGQNTVNGTEATVAGSFYLPKR